MKPRGLIFDLDQTLVDSSALDAQRRARDWKSVMRQLDRVIAYPRIRSLIERLQAEGHGVAVVTSSPAMYAKAVLATHYPSIGKIVAYHDCTRHKPDAEPILKGVTLLGISPERTVSIGDTHTDIAASRAANVYSIGATWGIASVAELTASKPNELVTSAADLEKALRRLGYFGKIQSN